MIPSPERFAEKMAERGIGDGDRVVVYDAVGLSSAGRAWWMLRLYGHDNVALLDGGLPKWQVEGARSTAPSRSFRRAASPPFPAELVRDKEAIRANLTRRAEQVVDARAAAASKAPRGNLAGAAPRPYPGEP